MHQLQISEKVTQKNESQQTEKVLDLRGENDQLEKFQASNEALRAQNKNLMHKVPEAWVVHNGSLYYFSCTDKSWEEAERFCVSLGSHLTSVTSVEEQEFIRKKAGGSNYWIGLNILRNSEWRWTDGTHYNEAKSKDFWAPDEPNKKDNNEHCVHFSKNRLQSWNDNNCASLFLFVCKWDCKSSELCPGM
ncbi:C-type lectin domain family 4 member K-like isoform X2 [Notamacropus eugenii]|uniref:C-type lectin domain family 4 member K-like isoform X2 n=1 Tax=Notamacropus eugenii TaxID=9315 RepID=UPI003B677BEA